MAETPRHTDLKRQGYERRDINIRWIAYFGVSLVALHLVGAALMLGLFGIFESERRRVDTPAPLAETRPSPPEPHLQASPAQDMMEMLTAEQRLLDHYAWVDPSTGIVRIPIERAMELAAQQGLPDWSEASGEPGGDGAATGAERGTEGQEQGPQSGEGGS